MALRHLRLDGDELLRKKSKPVKEITGKITALLDDMLETMRHYEGLGIAAPQVGVLRRAVVIEVEDAVYEFINPVITETDGAVAKDEGCLSIPGKVGTVERPEKAVVSYLNREGETCTLMAEGTLAVAVCHEIDHLDGVLYKDKALPNTFRDAEHEDEDKDKEDKENGESRDGSESK